MAYNTRLMNFDFSHQRVLVTGAGKGIGRDLCLLLAQCGAHVVAVSRTASDLEALAKQMECTPIVADLGESEAAIGAAKQALQSGPIDTLVNNAGISLPQSFLHTTPAAWNQTLAVNVRAPLLMSQIMARDWIERSVGGAIVNVSSTASQRGLSDHAAYCASKGALDGLTRVMALELGAHQIRVNAVNPTVTLTPMAQMAWSDETKSAAMKARIPLDKFASVREVSQVIVWLLSSHAAMIHGACVPVDGGYLAV